MGVKPLMLDVEKAVKNSVPEHYNFSFSKALKLDSPSFSQVFNDGKSFRYPGIIIIFRRNTLSFSRIGIIISKKNVRKANQRNKLKRIVRESFRLNKQSLGEWDVVVLAKKDILKYSIADIRLGLEKAWGRLQVLYKKSS